MGLFSRIGSLLGIYLFPFLLAAFANIDTKTISPPKPIEEIKYNEVTPVTFIKKQEEDTMGGKRLSKGERMCRKVVADILKQKKLVANVCYNYRPDFLCNPRTKRNLEIDVYVEVVRPYQKLIAIEFNGRQHDEFVPKYHKTKTEFANQQFRDRFKAEVCKKMDIELIIISYSDIDAIKTDEDKETKIKEMIEQVL